MLTVNIQILQGSRGAHRGERIVAQVKVGPGVVAAPLLVALARAGVWVGVGLCFVRGRRVSQGSATEAGRSPAARAVDGARLNAARHLRWQCKDCRRHAASSQIAERSLASPGPTRDLDHHLDVGLADSGARQLDGQPGARRIFYNGRSALHCEAAAADPAIALLDIRPGGWGAEREWLRGIGREFMVDKGQLVKGQGHLACAMS
jgi:hypothetical protein